VGVEEKEGGTRDEIERDFGKDLKGTGRRR